MKTSALARVALSALAAVAVGGCGYIAEGAQIVSREIAAVVAPATSTPRPTARPSATATPLVATTPSPVSATTRAPGTPTAPTATPAMRATSRPGPTPTPSGSPEPAPTAKDTEIQLRVFQDLWKTVRDNYIYEDFNGVDWNGLKASTESKIKAGLRNSEFYALMERLIQGLNDDHSRFMSPQDVQEEQARFKGEQSYTGIGIQWDVNVEKKYVFVLVVYPGSPAESAGIKAHDHILAVEGEPAVNDGGTPIVSKVRGPEGTKVTITVRSPGGPPRDLTLTRAKVVAKTAVTGQILGAELAGSKRIGYIMLQTFYEEGIADQFRNALTSLMKGGNLDGLIIDIRNNGGGSLAELERTLGALANGTMGSETTRSGAKRQLRARGEKIGNSQTVPIAILTSKSSASAAEIFAGVLQAAKRARTVGQTTAGNIEVLYTYKFEDGSQALIASETFRLPDGTNWEGKGVAADVPVPNSGWDEFTETSDPAIGAAAALFK